MQPLSRLSGNTHGGCCCRPGMERPGRPFGIEVPCCEDVIIPRTLKVMLSVPANTGDVFHGYEQLIVFGGDCDGDVWASRETLVRPDPLLDFLVQMHLTCLGGLWRFNFFYESETTPIGYDPCVPPFEGYGYNGSSDSLNSCDPFVRIFEGDELLPSSGPFTGDFVRFTISEKSPP